VALVHDYLLVMRGAERTFATMATGWPGAPIYTSVYSAKGTRGAFGGRLVRTSPLQRIGARQRSFRFLLPLYPWAVGRLPVDRHRIVVSSSSGFAHGIRRGSGSVHVCYCHTPFRYAWHEYANALRQAPPGARRLLGSTLTRIRRWDLEASREVTHYVANSRTVQERIANFYGRLATIIHPPVDVDRFQPAEAEDFFLTVGELVPHKRVDVALEAARRAGKRIRVVGTGSELGRLRARYGSHAEFLGRVSDVELSRLYARAAALVVPNVEEFGISAVEAQAAGRPVLATGRGGVTETVRHGETGYLVPTGTVDEIAEAMASIDFDAFDSTQISSHARRFHPTRFLRELRAEVARIVSSSNPGHGP
jgi:glycosyltransferase involved in cell wall biosynthesis